KPAPELLGEVLVEVGRGREAIEPFQQALRRHPNRSLSVLGLARAHAAAGQTEAARNQFRALLANYDAADAGLPEVAEARRAIGGGIRDWGLGIRRPNPKSRIPNPRHLLLRSPCL